MHDCCVKGPWFESRSSVVFLSKMTRALYGTAPNNNGTRQNGTVQTVPHRREHFYPCTALFCTVGFPNTPYWPVPPKWTGHLNRYHRSIVYTGQIILYQMI